MRTNSNIDDLLDEYEQECCDFTDIDWVRKAALRYVETMQDSQVRCLLYVLALHGTSLNEILGEKK